MKYKAVHILILALLVATGLLTFLLFVSYSNQQIVYTELMGNIHVLQKQQNDLADKLVTINNANQKSLEDMRNKLTTDLVEYSTCTAKKSVGIINSEVLDAVHTICAPPFVNNQSDFQSKNPIFLNCFIEKGIGITNTQSTENLNQECILYEQEISHQISISIQKSNNE
jgi:hypothetical protein